MHLLRNIQELREKGELEEETENPECNAHTHRSKGLQREDSMEIKSKFVKSDVLTIEVPKKCKNYSVIMNFSLKEVLAENNGNQRLYK